MENEMWIVIKFHDCHSLDDISGKSLNKIVRILEKTGLRYGYELNRKDLIDLK